MNVSTVGSLMISSGKKLKPSSEWNGPVSQLSSRGQRHLYAVENID